MARTYYNAGLAGRDYGQLTVEQDGNVLRFSTSGETRAPVLSHDQVRDLVTHLRVWLGEREPKPVEPPVMMEGEL